MADEYVKLVFKSDGTPGGHRVETEDGRSISGVTEAKIHMLPDDLIRMDIKAWGPIDLTGDARVKWITAARCPLCRLKNRLRSWHYRLKRGLD